MKKVLLLMIGTVSVYLIFSLILMQGNLLQEHRFSYDSIENAKSENALVKEDMNVQVVGDSLATEMKNVRVWVTKSVYQRFYGVAINSQHENKDQRRVMIDRKGNSWILKDWYLYYRGRMIGNLNHSVCDAVIGDSVTIDVLNSKDSTVGNIIMRVE